MKIISGGQTGVDRAALDVAIQLGLPHGGWCPAGRRAEDGKISPHYYLHETPSADYIQRTKLNIQSAHATLVLTPIEPSTGTLRTIELATELKKPCGVFRIGKKLDDWNPEVFTHWRAKYLNVDPSEHDKLILNIAGPRESKCPGVYALAKDWLFVALQLPVPSNILRVSF